MCHDRSLRSESDSLGSDADGSIHRLKPTEQNLRLVQAFAKISSAEDREAVIALAQALASSGGLL